MTSMGIVVEDAASNIGSMSVLLSWLLVVSYVIGVTRTGIRITLASIISVS